MHRRGSHHCNLPSSTCHQQELELERELVLEAEAELAPGLEMGQSTLLRKWSCQYLQRMPHTGLLCTCMWTMALGLALVLEAEEELAQGWVLVVLVLAKGWELAQVGDPCVHLQQAASPDSQTRTQPPELVVLMTVCQSNHWNHTWSRIAGRRHLMAVSANNHRIHLVS